MKLRAKHYIVSTRLSEDEHATLRQNAAAQGFSNVSAFLRHCLAPLLGEQRSVDVLKELARLTERVVALEKLARTADPAGDTRAQLKE